MTAICSPHCGFSLDSGGAVYERELLAHLPEVHRHPGRRGYRWWLAWGPWAATILRCWKQTRFDVLRAHSARFTGPACLLARRAGVRTPLIMHHHHLDPDWQSAVDVWALRRADVIVTDSQFSRHQLEDQVVAHIRVVEPGVRLWPSADPVHGEYALFVGALKPRKNVAWLVSQWRYVNFPLVIVGDGPCRRKIEPLLAPHIRLVGRAPDSHLASWYARAAFFVFPTLLEGYGMPVADALAAGLPCLVSDRGSLPELVDDGMTGRVVPLRTAEFQVAAKELASDPRLRGRMGEAARGRPFRTWTHVAREVRACYMAVGGP